MSKFLIAVGLIWVFVTFAIPAIEIPDGNIYNTNTERAEAVTDE